MIPNPTAAMNLEEDQIRGRARASVPGWSAVPTAAIGRAHKDVYNGAFHNQDGGVKMHRFIPICISISLLLVFACEDDPPDKVPPLGSRVELAAGDVWLSADGEKSRLITSRWARAAGR
jgi:hypothetical protein